MLPLRSIQGSRSRGGADGRCRAFTIIEVVIALAILLAISALVLPPMVARTRERAEREGVEMAKAACSRASSESQRRGVPILLAAVAELEHVRLVGTRVDPGADESGVVREVFSIDLPRGVIVTKGDAGETAEVPAPGGSSAPAAPESRAFGAAARSASGDAVARVGARTTLTLAFPDGRCAGGEFDLVMPSARRTRFTLSEWTSTVRTRAIEAPTPPTSPGDAGASDRGADDGGGAGDGSAREGGS